MLEHNPLVAFSSTDMVLAVWFAALGGAVGSFLNVVVYRLPAGLSIVHPGSHCPRCKRPIRWHDNVPVFGWLWLRGRCRDCRLPIAPRYPLVEAFAAAIFVAVVLVEVLLDGVNLPSHANRSPDDAVALMPIQQLGMAGYHLFLLATLLPAALMAWDGKQPPAKLYGAAIAVGALLPVVLGDFLHPVAACACLGSWADGWLGATAGVGCGLVLARLGEPRIRAGDVLATLCVGLYLGWQAAIGIAAIAAVATLVSSLASRGRRGTSTVPIWLFLATLAWIFAWRWLVWC